jgi:ribosomal protein S4
MAGKKRLDMLVVDMGLAPSRQRAQALYHGWQNSRQ